MWTPIKLTELYDLIHQGENNMFGELWNLWQQIKIDPSKWQEDTYGNEGGGFWVVGICGNNVIWYNDIEEGFNISNYNKYGHINGYYCNQCELDECINQILYLIKYGGNTIIKAGPPQNL